MQIEMDLVNLTELPELMEGYFSKSAESKNLEFEIEMADDLPDMIYSDGMRLHQILRNLLSNAIKFTESGAVKLRVKKMNSIVTSDFVISGDVIAFPLRILASGLPQSIFNRSSKRSSKAKRLQPEDSGTGLGLSISSHLAKPLAGILPWRARKESGARLFYIYRR